MKTNRERADELLNNLLDCGVSERSLLEFILNNYMSGTEAVEALVAANDEFFEGESSFDDEEEVEEEY
tara:strand:- start:3025 stop:3228 length:204 start_codon:yes stop_codon:yes gene_type:complete